MKLKAVVSIISVVPLITVCFLQHASSVVKKML